MDNGACTIDDNEADGMERRRATFEPANDSVPFPKLCSGNEDAWKNGVLLLLIGHHNEQRISK